MVPSNTNGYNSALWINDCKAHVSNSIINLYGGNDLFGVEASNNDFTLVNTQIRLYPAPEAYSVVAVDFSPNGSVTGRVANSLIQGGLAGIPNLANLKLINNYDENFNPVANQ